jgi:hypothetical protein
MNLEHLGDALDFWKGGLMVRLINELNDIHVLPMFTDATANWTPQRLDLYAQLLGVQTPVILRSDVQFTAISRVTYFQDIACGDADLFADPDVGTQPNGGGDCRHIRFLEIAQLLPVGAKRVLLVYQHSFREENWTGIRLQDVIGNLPGCSAFAYWAGSVSMIFIARDRQRLTNMFQVLQAMTASLPPNIIRVLPIVP